MMKQVDFWDGKSTDGATIMLVSPDIKSDFIEFFHGNCFTVHPEHVYFVSNKALTPEDKDFLVTLIAEKYNLTTNAKSDFMDLIKGLKELDNFSIRNILVNKYIVKNNIFLSFILRSFQVLLSKFEELEKIYFFQFPYLFDNNWIDSSPSLITHNNHVFRKSNIGSSAIERIYDEKIYEIEELLKNYNRFNIHERLILFSSYFFSMASEFKNKKDPTQATIFMHRALETLFLSWLVEDRDISIGAEGKVSRSGGKHLYLIDYMDMLKGRRSISDVEKLAVRELNNLRNESKYAHGYVCIDANDFHRTFEGLKSLFFNDDGFRKSYFIFRNIVEYPEELLSTLYKCILETNYLEKF